MASENNLKEALAYWNDTRGESRELLEQLHDGHLQFKPPGDAWQPLYYQFGCMIHTQLVYTRALLTSRMDFTYFDDPEIPDKHTAQTRELLDGIFIKVGAEWERVLESAHDVIHWPHGEVSVGGHIYRLAAHERLHHGQLISYFTLANIPFPQKFKDTWSL